MCVCFNSNRLTGRFESSWVAPCTFHSMFPSGNILNYFCTISKPRNRHWYDLQTPFHMCVCDSTCTHLSVCLFVWNFMQFYHIYWIYEFTITIKIQNFFFVTKEFPPTTCLESHFTLPRPCHIQFLAITDPIIPL